MKTTRIVPVVLLTLLVGLGLKDVRTKTTDVPSPCRVGQQAPAIGFWTWAANSRVRVYIHTADFSSEQLPCLLTALQNWNNVLEQTGSGVKFEYQGSTTKELTCENCLTIERGTVFDNAKRHATELRAYSARRDQIITYATILVDPVLTNPRALLNALAHEIGHNLGLLDCYSCKHKSTVMNQFKIINVSNDMDAPTPCDIAQVREAYKELKLRVRPSPPNRNLIDEGEEPVDDDTPIIIPKP